jgi:hypothetical protein
MNIYLQKLQTQIEHEKYFRWYSVIIERAETRPKTKKDVPFYTERHHILPKCLCETDFEKNDVNNHALLTLKEHALVHKLLTKAAPTSKKLKRAYMGMLMARNNKQEKVMLSIREYEFLRENSKDLYSRSGKENGMFGKKQSEKTKQKIREKAIGRKMSEEVKQKRSISQIGEKNYFYGKTHTEETRRAIAEKLSGKTTYVKCYILADTIGNEYKVFTKEKLIDFCAQKRISYKKIEAFLNKGNIPSAKVVGLMNERTKNSVGWSAISKTIPILDLFTVL